VLPVLLLVGVGAWVASCATTEPPAFSDGDCVAGGCAQTSGSSSGTTTSVACTVNTACAVSWQTDIFTAILDGPAGCTGTGLCHGVGGGGITLVSGQAGPAYTALIDYTIANGPKYIIPCDPQHSGFTCNMALAAGQGTDPYLPACGIAMPFGTTGMDLTLAQLTTIADWIQCGAPNN
jgi:hypothetical protein